MIEMKKLISQVSLGTHGQPNLVSNTTLLSYTDFEKVLIEIALTTLQVSANQAEKLKIFLMHIRNACKINYQISSFAMEKKGGSKTKNMPLQVPKVDSNINKALQALKSPRDERKKTGAQNHKSSDRMA
jgi:hypothetical protein